MSHAVFDIEGMSLEELLDGVDRTLPDAVWERLLEALRQWLFLKMKSWTLKKLGELKFLEWRSGYASLYDVGVLSFSGIPIAAQGFFFATYGGTFDESGRGVTYAWGLTRGNGLLIKVHVEVHRRLVRLEYDREQYETSVLSVVVSPTNFREIAKLYPVDGYARIFEQLWQGVVDVRNHRIQLQMAAEHDLQTVDRFAGVIQTQLGLKVLSP